VYAWGSAEDDNLALAVQTIRGLHSPPTGVPGGTGGQAADSSGGSMSTGWAIVAGGGLAALFAGLVMSRRSPRTVR
jgi:hypothetical protein